MSTLSGLKKRRSTTTKSIARLVRRLSNLEGKEVQPSTYNIAQEIARGLAEHDQEFKEFHYQMLDLMEDTDDDALDREQNELDDMMDDANLRVKQLLAASSAHADSPNHKVFARKHKQLANTVTSVNDAVRLLTTESDQHLIQQYYDRIQAHKLELRVLAEELLNMELSDTHDLNGTEEAG